MDRPVSDARIDQEIRVLMINLGTSAHLLINPVPSLPAALSGFIEDLNPKRSARIEITHLDLVNKVGYASNDELRCHISSSLSVEASKSRQVVSRSIRKDTSSTFGYTAAKIILDDCLAAHARDIAKMLEAWPSIGTTHR